MYKVQEERDRWIKDCELKSTPVGLNKNYPRIIGDLELVVWKLNKGRSTSFC